MLLNAVETIGKENSFTGIRVCILTSLFSQNKKMYGHPLWNYIPQGCHLLKQKYSATTRSRELAPMLSVHRAKFLTK